MMESTLLNAAERAATYQWERYADPLQARQARFVRPGRRDGRHRVVGANREPVPGTRAAQLQVLLRALRPRQQPS